MIRSFHAGGKSVDAPALEMQGIVKRFPGVTANNGVDLKLDRGEVHALLGENGAGKTTLMNILYGLYRQDEGRILRNGSSLSINRPIDAIRAGIGMVHQHFMLVPVLTVAENMIIGREEIRFGAFLNIKKATRKIKEISAKYGLEVDPDALVGDLPVGLRQRVEILKTLYREADVLILDEPTAVLTPGEIESLFRTLLVLKSQGKSVIFITHKLREVMEIADRITILRGGAVVGCISAGETTEEDLASLMVGRNVVLKREKKKADVQGDVLEVRNLTVPGERGEASVDDVSFTVRKGEIYGLAGVQGNGQTELIEAVAGLRKSISGTIRINKKDLTNKPAGRFLESGVAHIPEDRHYYGMVEKYSIAENLILNNYKDKTVSNGVTIDHEAVVEKAARLMREFDIRAPGVFTDAGSLSGGNQQRMVIAREFSRDAELFIIAQPTRGLDVGSAEYIHKRIIKKRDEGCAVFLVSTELDEIMSLSDRIGVMYRGRIIDQLESGAATKERIGRLMAGLADHSEKDAGGAVHE